MRTPIRDISTLLTAQQRAVIHQDTRISPFIIDRCVDAFDAIIQRGDVDAYKVYMTNAVAQLGYDGEIPDSERPTAVDKIKTILIHAYAMRLHTSYRSAHKRLEDMLRAG